MSGSDTEAVTPPVAIRTDRSTGITEEIAFASASPEGDRIFTALHLPAGAVTGRVVLCSPLHAEMQENYRQEVVLARSMAARGLAVQRFHYRGSGHSDGDSSDSTYASMRDDARTAARLLGARIPGGRIAFLGTRWGGLVAASAAAGGPGPLVLFAPTLDADRYFRDAHRARLIHAIKSGRSEPPTGEDFAERIRREGRIDVLGYPLDARLYESAKDVTLAEEIGDGSRPVLLVQFSRRPDLRPDHARLVDDLRRRGARVATAIVPEQPAWWFSRKVLRDIDGLAGRTADWIIAALAAGEAT